MIVLRLAQEACYPLECAEQYHRLEHISAKPSVFALFQVTDFLLTTVEDKRLRHLSEAEGV